MKTFICWLIACASEIIMGLEFFAIVIIKSNNLIIKDMSSNKEASDYFFIFSCLATLIFAIFIMIYTYRNIDEVISRQFKWKNSRVSTFDYRLKYSLSRGILALPVGVMLFYAIWLLFNFQ